MDLILYTVHASVATTICHSWGGSGLPPDVSSGGSPGLMSSGGVPHLSLSGWVPTMWPIPWCIWRYLPTTPRTDRHTPMKTLPSRNFICGGNINERLTAHCLESLFHRLKTKRCYTTSRTWETTSSTKTSTSSRSSSRTTTAKFTATKPQVKPDHFLCKVNSQSVSNVKKFSAEPAKSLSRFSTKIPDLKLQITSWSNYMKIFPNINVFVWYLGST